MPIKDRINLIVIFTGYKVFYICSLKHPMSMTRIEETVCAPATSPGGAISVIRVSGPLSIEICGRIFSPSDSRVVLREQKGYRIFHGTIYDNGEFIDEVLVTVFRAPHSYTGQDSVEISCHGSSFIITRIMELFLRQGALPARPGEFTMRAFLNGRMDLSQAEAVADLVASGTSEAHRVAINQMRGGFSKEIAGLRSELLRFATLIELELDFGEEDVEFADRDELKSIVINVKNLTDNLLSSFRLGNVIKNGIPVVITGKPNSGKSTLLNALLKEERAIVSEIPGTTRDAIDDVIVINGLQYRFSDTAGLRDTSDIIESLGIDKTYDRIEKASVILLVDDALEDPLLINQRADEIRRKSASRASLMVLINKTDISTPDKIDDLRSKIRLEAGEYLLFISAREKTGIDNLMTSLAMIVDREKLDSGSSIVTNIRHFDALRKVSESLERVISGLEEGLSEDFLAIDLRHAIHYLGEITGEEISSEEILGNIFRNFCIGK